MQRGAARTPTLKAASMYVCGNLIEETAADHGSAAGSAVPGDCVKVLWVLPLVALMSLAGCMGGGAAPDVLSVSHSESSETSRIVIESMPRAAFTYEHFFVDIEGKRYVFGEFASFDERRYQVEGKKDAISNVEQGDIISVVAAGTSTVQLLRDDHRLAIFEANIPDNRAPAAPVPLEPAAKAAGVSRTPTFRWSAVTDPSGVSYTLVYSLDPNFQAPALTAKAEKLTANNFEVAGGKELSAGQTYYWRVQAVDGASNSSSWSQSGEFVVAGGPLG